MTKTDHLYCILKLEMKNKCLFFSIFISVPYVHFNNCGQFWYSNSFFIQLKSIYLQAPRRLLTFRPEIKGIYTSFCSIHCVCMFLNCIGSRSHNQFPSQKLCLIYKVVINTIFVQQYCIVNHMSTFALWVLYCSYLTLQRVQNDKLVLRLTCSLQWQQKFQYSHNTSLHVQNVPFWYV